MILPVIIAGGSGSRLWPLSRSGYPKQFLSLFGKNTMLQETVLRLKGLEHQQPLLICNEEHRFIAAEQLREVEVATQGILLEPVSRNTAPAIALAALQAIKGGNDPLLLVLAADHVISNVTAFQETIKKASVLAEQDKLVTFGVIPNKAETGYGYIRRGESIGDGFSVCSFIEKPNIEIAKQYITSDLYYWNSGMFLFKASQYLAELKRFEPNIYDSCRLALSDNKDSEFIRLNEIPFKACPENSIDYAVMERTDKAAVIPLDTDWSDVGSFGALWGTCEHSESGNKFHGDVLQIDTKNTFAYSEEKLIATVGIENLVIINTKDALLVAHRDKTQQVKQIVDQLKEQNRTEATTHREVYRPWGKYDSVDVGERFQVKRITVKPGAKLSVQMHHHRSEHWVVVSGTAKVTIDQKEQYLTENESVYIPVASVHSLENVGVIDLKIIEVQSGSYLGEDDIVRFEDRYGRLNNDLEL